MQTHYNIVGVVGAGAMGRGIAQIAAAHDMTEVNVRQQLFRLRKELRAAGLLDNRPLPGSIARDADEIAENPGQSELFED